MQPRTKKMILCAAHAGVCGTQYIFFTQKKKRHRGNSIMGFSVSVDENNRFIIKDDNSGWKKFLTFQQVNGLINSLRAEQFSAVDAHVNVLVDQMVTAKKDVDLVAVWNMVKDPQGYMDDDPELYSFLSHKLYISPSGVTSWRGEVLLHALTIRLLNSQKIVISHTEFSRIRDMVYTK